METPLRFSHYKNNRSPKKAKKFLKAILSGKRLKICFTNP